jgi:HlyD family secretion protein
MKIPITLPRQFWFAIFGVALLLALIWVALKSGPLAPIQVTVTQAAKEEVPPALFGIGTVEARRAYLIGSTIAGRVGRVLADVGDTVQAGQLLAEMDPVDIDARVSSAAAARAKNAVTTAQAQVEDAQADLARAEDTQAHAAADYAVARLVGEPLELESKS